MVTLTRAVEAAREYLIDIAENSYHADGEDAANYRIAKMAIAALPEKPMTEEEIFETIMASNKWNDGGLVLSNNARNIIRALKDAGCLYVGEK